MCTPTRGRVCMPELAPALRAAGFIEVSRTELLACIPATFRPVAPASGLAVETLDADPPFARLRESFATNAVVFDGPGAVPAADEAIERWRRELVEGRAFTVRLDSEVVGAGMLPPPLDGLAELVGVGTLAPYRRRGVASLLTSHAAWTAFELGVEAVFLSTDNAGARHIYERAGRRPAFTVLTYADPR